MQLERDLLVKEQQTLNVLRELESAKRFVEGLKLNLMPHFSSFIDSPDERHVENPASEGIGGPSPCLMFNELNRAKLNLSKTSVDLAAIQACVESLNTKLRKDKILLHRPTQAQEEEAAAISVQRNQHGVQANFEAEQFKKMTEASRYEVMEAMAEIERTKNCIKMAEMRLNAAKKMEEAAKAVEAIAIAQRNPHRNGDVPPSYFPQDGITLSFEEYKALSHKAKQAEELYKTKFIDKEAPILEKFEETTNRNKVSFDQEGPNHTNVVIEDSFSRNKFSKFKFRNSHAGDRTTTAEAVNVNDERPDHGFRSTTSIGNLLSRKVIVQDDVMVERNVENGREREHVSLSQMLREQSRLILHPSKNSGEGGKVQKQYFMQRKKFGFIQVPIPTKQSKKKSAAS